MSLYLEKLEKPKITKVTMNCDLPIDPKLEKYESIKTCFSNHNFTILAGLMGQGKTSTMISLMKNVFRKCYNDVYVIIPQISLHSISDKDNIFLADGINDEDHLYHEYNGDTLETIYQKLVENASDDYTSMLIIDDFGANFRTDKQAEKVLNKIIIKMRHLKCSIFLLGQNIFQLPRKWREIATNLICFNLGKSQMKKIFDEFFEYKQEQFDEIMKLYKSPHDYLLLNLKYKRLFYNFDEVKFNTIHS
jgi:hypothetical protein